MKIKETRGRPRKYNFELKKGQVSSFSESNNKTIQILFLSFAKKHGFKFRTWNEQDVLFIKRVS